MKKEFKLFTVCCTVFFYVLVLPNFENLATPLLIKLNLNIRPKSKTTTQSGISVSTINLFSTTVYIKIMTAWSSLTPSLTTHPYHSLLIGLLDNLQCLYLSYFLQNIICFLPFWVQSHFLFVDLLMFKVYNVGKLWTYIVLLYLFVKLQYQCWRSQCHHQLCKPML